jgi:hypothetical protein
LKRHSEGKRIIHDGFLCPLFAIDHRLSQNDEKHEERASVQSDCCLKRQKPKAANINHHKKSQASEAKPLLTSA